MSIELNRERSREYSRSHPEENRKRVKEWSSRNPDRHLKRRYGINLKDYDKILTEQKGGCAICGQPCPSGRKLAVDHDHITGKIRGLLCIKCNRALGELNDDPVLFNKALQYLERNK